MTISDILEQVRELSPQERDELLDQLLAMREAAPSGEEQPEEHWGKSLNRLMDEIGPIEMRYPEIEDPVEWVKHLRAEERRRRLGDWGEEEHSDEAD